MPEEILQGLQALGPVALVEVEPGGGGSERQGDQAAHVLTAGDRLLDQADPLEDLYMFGGGGQRHGEGLGQLADGQLAFGQAAEHGAAGSVGQSVKDRIEVRRLFNHMVEVIRNGMNCQPVG